MRVLGIGDYGDLGDMYLRLATTGHDVRMHIADADYQSVFAGMVDHCPEWGQGLEWIRDAGPDGVIIFETARHGVLQDELRAGGFNVIGGCALGDRLEGDRSFGQEVMRLAGMRTAPVHHFHDFAVAIDFIAKHPRRYVYKPNGHHLPSTHSFVGRLDDGTDVRALLGCHKRLCRTGEIPDFILMDHVSGVETGVGAYFDGRRFILPACLDWEHKRFFPGELGELTGEMGTLVTYQGAERLFAETLAPLASMLASAGYRGYLNLNTIINAEGVWPLEFTCRFGYPGFAILSALQSSGWDEVLAALLGRAEGFGTIPGYALGAVLTVPPFPYMDAERSLARGLPITFLETLSEAERQQVHYGEVASEDGGLVTAGASGYTLVATGVGATVRAAQQAAYGLLERIVVPNGRYRRDIGERFLAGEGRRLAQLGYLPASLPIA